jgi:hypothetical protein|tara:strand:+ start:623 stop:865 length:243 start_codon:yes stop_codon:yes gene_type:complete
MKDTSNCIETENRKHEKLNWETRLKTEGELYFPETDKVPESVKERIIYLRDVDKTVTLEGVGFGVGNALKVTWIGGNKTC